MLEAGLTESLEIGVAKKKLGHLATRVESFTPSTFTHTTRFSLV